MKALQDIFLYTYLLKYVDYLSAMKEESLVCKGTAIFIFVVEKIA